VGTIKDKVAIVGMGCVKFGENWDKSLEDMIVEAAYEAFEDAGLGPEDIQAAWWGSVFAGESGSIMSTPLKLAYILVTHVGEPVCHGLGGHPGSRLRGSGRDLRHRAGGRG
jgi:acetyl-CoA C-acetyltransferase